MHRIYKFLKFMGKMLRLTVFFVLFLICGAEAQATSKLSNSVCYAYMETCVHKIENLVTTLKDESCRGIVSINSYFFNSENFTLIDINQS